MFFRRLQGLFAVKMWCGNGKMVVRRWWFGFAISVEIHCVSAVVVFVAVSCHVEIGKILCIFGESEVQ